MNTKLNILLVRVFQGIVGIFYLGAVTLWFGGLALFTLAVWMYSAAILESIGFGGILASLLGLGVTSALVYYVAKIQPLACTLLKVGTGLAKTGFAAFTSFDDLAKNLKEEGRFESAPEEKLETATENKSN